MSNIRKCPRCGSAHPSSLSECPRASSPPVDPEFISPYDDEDEATFKRKPSGLAAPVAVRPLVDAVAPSPYAGEEEEWEASVNRDVMVGKKLADYVVKRRIGAGGMGIVYEGEHPVIGRKVAIKILRPDFADGGRSTRDLASEARAASAIRHRGIIDIFGFGTIPGVGQYLVMEYLDGLPLDEVINQRAPMLEAEAVHVLDELLAALEAAHSVGVIHRDLKPGNVFVVRDSGGNEHVKVLDFGLAKRSEAPYGATPQTRQSMMVGTPEYMAPEQACGQQVSPHTDLYAVGVIAFEMLTRRLPFEGPSPMAIAVHHVRTPPPPPSTYVELHPALEALVMRLLAKEPGQRPSSAEAVRRELKGILKLLTSDATQLAPPPALGAAATVSEEPSVSVAPVPARVRTERSGPVQRRPAPKAAAPQRPLTAPPRRHTPAPAELFADKTTAMELDAMPSGKATAMDLEARPSDKTQAVDMEALRPSRSRAVFAAVGGAALLGVIAAAAVMLGSGDESGAPMPKPLPPGAVASSALRTLPDPVVAPPPAEPVPAPAVDAMAGEVRPASAKEPVLTATALAKVSETSTALDAQPARASAKTERATAPQRGSRTPGPRKESPREEDAPASQAAAQGTGTLVLVMKNGGWGTVFVDGEELGDVPPMNRLSLPAGRHEVELVGNPSMQPYSKIVSITAGQTQELTVELRRRVD